MMRNVFLIVLSCWSCISFGQDFLAVPSSNPRQFQINENGEIKDKLDVIEVDYIYRYDTLELPFIDDFSTDHFPSRISDTNSNRLSDTLVYSILLANGSVFSGTTGFTDDSTYTYSIGMLGDTVNTTVNPTTVIQYADLNTQPVTYRSIAVYPAFNTFDTVVGGSVIEIVPAMYLQDSLEMFAVAPDPNDYYIDRSVYRNSTFAIRPPSVGVVTFDGLDEFGLPYDITMDIRVAADELTSVPINLAGLPDTNVYFSFYYQPKGRSIDKPEREDSLALDFYNVTTQSWANVWRTIGFESDTFLFNIIKVPNDFHQKGFQFRFRNYASSSGAFDQWHVDYIYLNNDRTIADTIQKDIAYIYDAPSLLKDFYAMPYFHFINNPVTYMTDTVVTFVTNPTDQNLPIYNKVVIPDTSTGTDFYQHPPNNNSFVIFPPKFETEFEYPINFAFPSNKVDSAGEFTAIFDIDFRPPMAQEQDFIRSNDTIIGKAVLKNYYAYDDGTAEAGYGVNPVFSPNGNIAYMAVEFNIPFPDTLGGVQFYFLPQTVDVTKQNFVITVWNSLDPTNIIYEKTVQNSPVYSDDNGYVNYGFDSTIIVNQTFFIGIKAIGINSMNMGYDLNTNHRDKIFWSLDGSTWNNPSNGIFDGSLMLRPFFRERLIGVGIGENGLATKHVVLYPNPVRDQLNLQLDEPSLIRHMQILDIRGQLIKEMPYQPSIELGGLSNGIYLLRLVGREGDQLLKKFIVSQ